ncbi:hypothetical protein CRG98_032024 [Punica granatum]|uniref:Uncharacterized protein n=1 Tax=Punica granatum TaxID=22663 RepID=A0A2I0IUZ1_PUNGR|nr:hypothetical protein CRG98_032024 [Punica granatum]
MPPNGGASELSHHHPKRACRSHKRSSATLVQPATSPWTVVAVRQSTTFQISLPLSPRERGRSGKNHNGGGPVVSHHSFGEVALAILEINNIPLYLVLGG